MRNTFKKVTSLLAATLITTTAFSFVGCSSGGYAPQNLQGSVAGEAISNGGFAVEKGDFVYFINGSEEYTANNTLGKVKKGALMRIAKADLSAREYDAVEMVVPSLFVAQDMTAGIFLYGDYVYYASPTTEKERDGKVANSYLSFHKAKLDGSSTEEQIKDYLFRLDDNTTKYRYVEVDGVVYCVYVDGTDKVLYSFNTKTGEKTTLVEGASSDFFFDTVDLENPTVYYTMAVTEDIDSENPVTLNYNQLYAVRADATAEVKKSGNTVSYEVSGGYTYSFDHGYLSDKVDGYKEDDYTTFPYVNLGTLVLDGKGSSLTSSPETQYNHDADSTPATPNGYTYNPQNYSNGELFFTRKDVNASMSDGDGSELYYLSDATKGASDWKSIGGNARVDVSKIALSTTNASATALYEPYAIPGDNAEYHRYIYTSGSKIHRATAKYDGTIVESVVLATGMDSATLLKTEGDYLYYYKSGINGNHLYRVKYNGNADCYGGLTLTDEYEPLRILDVDWNADWYVPELVCGDKLLYSNAQSFGGVSYNYINVVDLKGANGLMTNEELKAFNEKQEEVEKYFKEFENSGYKELAKTLRYYFRTGETKVFDEFIAEAKAQGYKDHYRYSEYELNEFALFTSHEGDYAEMFKDGDRYYDVESYFYSIIGVMKDADAKAIAEVWKSSEYIKPLPKLEVAKDDTAKLVWTIVGVAAGVLVLATAITIPLVIRHKKKAKLKADLAATAVRKRASIDTTDDKSIDVYEVESTEETNE